ncbi:MAG TPA: hypothetical protein VN028_03130 [Rhodocyclaceae bacterium]|nr:hypothetical protein [Rhodocyclaceae bacterium]
MHTETFVKSLGWAALLAVANPTHAATSMPLPTAVAPAGASFSTFVADPHADIFVAADQSDPLASGAALPASAGFGNTLLGATYDALSRSYLYSGLAAGAYYLRTADTGWALSSPAGAVVATGASRAPTPQDYAMFLAGLGIVGTVIRRRSRSF